ncbi:MAG: hypothetical protein AAGA21_00840 [Pseudomonadota bacterium]
MQIRHDSVHFRVLERLCAMPKAVRGMAPAMLQRQFGDLVAVEELAAAGLLKKRGWADGPGWVWVPTEAGLALHQSMGSAPHQSPALTSGDRVILPSEAAREGDPAKRQAD